MKDRLRAHFAANRERYEAQILDLLGQLVAQRTVNAGRDRLDECPGQEVPGEETRCVEVLKPWLDELGVDYAVHALHPRRANLIATLGSGDKALAVGVHTDIVPPGDGWSTDPYVPTLVDGQLFGRGVLDNKGPLAACWGALQLLVECEIPLNGRFLLAAIASEEFREVGEPDPGIGYLLETGALKPDFAIIPDIGEHMRRIDIAEKGRLAITVRALGKQAHGSTPELGVNAVNQLARLLVALEEHTLSHEVHPVLGEPSVNVGIVRGGSAANIVPGEASAVVDIRYVPGMTAEGVVAELRALADEIGGEWRWELGDVSLPHAICADNDLVHAIRASTRELLGFDPEPFGMGGGTFAKTFNLGGIPAVGWGPGDDEAFHVTDEWIDVDQLVDFALLLALVAVDLLGIEGATDW